MRQYDMRSQLASFQLRSSPLSSFEGLQFGKLEPGYKAMTQLNLCILLRNSHKSSLFPGRQLVSVGVRRRSMFAV